MEKILECVPNFSEGINNKTIKKIQDTIKSIKKTKLLHSTSDKDHNRTVITFIGPPESVIQSAFLAIKIASKEIDLTKHTGIHPRIGATDVVPLIPLKNINKKEAIQLSKKLGKKVATELGIPVFLYENSAETNKRQNLANIRNSAFKKKPDYEPTKDKLNKKAGYTVIGVRDLLIAFNVNLKTNDVKIAKKIAKKIRESSGGLKNIKALGLNLKSRDLAQISMNLTNYKITGLKKVFDLIKKEAEKHNTEILESELIGMIPQEALFKNAPKYLKIKGFSKNQILKT